MSIFIWSKSLKDDPEIAQGAPDVAAWWPGGLAAWLPGSGLCAQPPDSAAGSGKPANPHSCSRPRATLLLTGSCGRERERWLLPRRLDPAGSWWCNSLQSCPEQQARDGTRAAGKDPSVPHLCSGLQRGAVRLACFFFFNVPKCFKF